MRLTIIFSALLSYALARPSPETAAEMIQRFTEIPDCQLPDAGKACSGAARKDVIVHYGKDTTQAEKDLFLNAAKAAGAQIHGVMDNFGFTAFVPDHVVSLMKAHATTCGLTIYENGCTGVPWCGEAPC